MYRLDQTRGDNAIDYPEYLARDRWAAGKEKAQLEWKTEHPLALRLTREFLSYQQSGTPGDAARTTNGAETAAFATESNQAFLVASFASYPAAIRVQAYDTSGYLRIPAAPSRAALYLPRPTSVCNPDSALTPIDRVASSRADGVDIEMPRAPLWHSLP